MRMLLEECLVEKHVQLPSSQVFSRLRDGWASLPWSAWDQVWEVENWSSAKTEAVTGGRTNSAEKVTELGFGDG